jgi:uncharacterized membrane protein
VKIRLTNEFVPIALLGVLFLALVAHGVQGLSSAAGAFRLLLGLFFTLFIPGYALLAALFPRHTDVERVERIALSFGLSLGLVPVIAIVLDKLPWGIHLWPIVLSESLFSALCGAIALYRRSQIPGDERYVPSIEFDIGGWWSRQVLITKLLYVVLLMAFSVVVLSAVAIIRLPKPGERFTEFYILGSGDVAQNYPRELVLGQAVTVTVGITNREGSDTSYRVEVLNDNHLIAVIEDLAVIDGKTVQEPLTFAPVESGDNVKVDFILYRNGIPEPYHQLWLWLTVKPSPG